MATVSKDLMASDETEKSETTIAEDLNCPLCQNVFRSPRRLPCLHSFCHDCLQSHITNTASTVDSVKELCCPICGNVACSGEISTDKLVHIFPINTLLLSMLMKSKVKADLVCNACQAEEVISPAEDFCTVCEEALCVQCSKVHRSSRFSITHTILKIEDLPSNLGTILQNDATFHCTDHACYPVELYCKDHETHLCARCFFTSHKNCSEVVDLTMDMPNLGDSFNQMKDQMQKIEDQIRMFTNTNLSNLDKLESKINDLTFEIRTLKKTINCALDDLEKRVKEEGNKMFSKEKKRIEQLNHGFQSHITAIRNSNVTVELASKYATQTHMFLLTKRIMNQLSLTKWHIDKMNPKNDILTLQLEVNPQLASITNISRGEIGSLKMKRNNEIPVVLEGFNPIKECLVKCVRIRYIQGLEVTTPWYTKVVFATNKQRLLIDRNNKLIYLMDLFYNIIFTYTFPGKPCDICMISKDVVAVTLPDKKSIHFLSLKDKLITYIKEIQTEYKCYSIATYDHEELVISGSCDVHRYYWSIITLEGKVKTFHNFYGVGTSQTFIALNAFKSRLYISVWKDNSLHCFGLDGMKHFRFTHHDLKAPQGVSVDRDDNVYLVGCLSENIFQLSPDGSLIRIFLTRTVSKPMGICFDQNGDRFVLTHLNDTYLSFYNLVNSIGDILRCMQI